MNSKLLIAIVMFTVACNAAQTADHSSILQEKGKTVRLILLDASSKPIAGANVEVGECKGLPCSVVARWTQKSGADGSVNVPRSLMHDDTVVGTRVNEPRPLNAARWEEDVKSWTIKLIGRVTMVCSKYDSTFTLLVAEDWRSAQLDQMDDSGLMHCSEGKDVFRICQGQQMPGGAFTAYITRRGDNFSARLNVESAQLNCFHRGMAEGLPRDIKAWTVEYGVIGGIAFLNRRLKLTQSGQLDVTFLPGEYESHISTRASPELVKKIANFLQVAEKEKPSFGKAIAPDAQYTSLALITNGSTYTLAIPDEIDTLLENTIEAAAKHALAGTWWESEWKLCKPKAQLTAAQMDPPIERLVFQEDGRFSVTWHGGGAEVPPGKAGEPFTWLPDYSGHYVIQPDRNSIHMTFENGVHPPRDFYGDGNVRINGDKLILNRVWLGTYKAKQKPDICEMTFKRSGGQTISEAAKRN